MKEKESKKEFYYKSILKSILKNKNIIISDISEGLGLLVPDIIKIIKDMQKENLIIIENEISKLTNVTLTFKGRRYMNFDNEFENEINPIFSNSSISVNNKNYFPIKISKYFIKSLDNNHCIY